MSDRVFLDANVLFSAAWREDSGLARLWDVSGAILVTSRYALAEAERNLDTEDQRSRLRSLSLKTTLVAAASGSALPAGVELVAKDLPILLAAIESGSTHLLTGDRRHFRALYGRTVAGVRILTPAEYLKTRLRSGKPRS
ncbi:MAG: PIN domain-containing protein [Betaproteobacteria bacterium]